VIRHVLDHPPTLGAVCGITAAALFGLSAPFSKALLDGSQPLVLAGLLYAGAAITLSLARVVRGPRANGSEPRLRKADVPLLLVVILTGGVLGPVSMLVGLQRVSSVAGSLLLNLEAPFTMIVAVLLFGEHMSRRGTRAAALIVGGGLALAWSAGGPSADILGTAALAGACLSWAVDNNLTQRLSLRDPVAIVQIKAAAAAAGNLLLATALGDARVPRCDRSHRCVSARRVQLRRQHPARRVRAAPGGRSARSSLLRDGAVLRRRRFRAAPR